MPSSTAGHTFRIAAEQAAPVFLNREATVDKACQLIEEAGHNAARLVVFPEAFITAYPDWVWAVPAGGEFIAGPLHEQEGIVYAEIDPAQMRGPKWMLDVAGHYARPDVFQLTVQRGARPMIRIGEGGSEAEDANA